MNKQEIFDKVVEHFKHQIIPATDASGDCMYRHNDGDKVLMCAVGCLITDSEYRPEMENGTVVSLIQENMLPERLVEHKDFLTELQCIHDGQRYNGGLLSKESAKDLRDLANDNNLNHSLVDWA